MITSVRENRSEICRLKDGFGKESWKVASEPDG